jgi:hypothetical protein
VIFRPVRNNWSIDKKKPASGERWVIDADGAPVFLFWHPTPDLHFPIIIAEGKWWEVGMPGNVYPIVVDIWS